MSTTFTTPLMNLVLPTVGEQIGPDWASNLNTALQLVDSHNHTSGQGSLIPTTGLNINADLTFGGFNATSLKSSRYSSQSGVLAGASDKSCVYVVSGNLYYNNSSGTAIQITAGSALNAASIGGIGGDYATSTASVFYTNATKVFSFTQAAGITAKLACGDLTIFENAAGTQGITLKSPAALGAAYSITLPTALPVSGTKILSITSLGVMGTAIDGDNSTIEINSNQIRLKAAGITSSVIATGGVASDNIAATVTNIAGNVAIAARGYYTVDTSAARAITLPAAVTGYWFFLKDKTGSCSTNNITVTRAAAESIEGVAANKVLQSDFGGWFFFCNGTDWFIG